MINKFKNVLKVGKKAKDAEEVSSIELVNDDLHENNELIGESHDGSEESDLSNEDRERGNGSDESAELISSEVETESADRIEDTADVEEVVEEVKESIFKVEAPKDKNVEDIGIPLGEYNLQELVCSTLKQFAPMIVKKGIRLELDDLNKQIITNEEVLLFIFQEVLSNAVNSLKEGSLKIYCVEDKLFFQDTGYGIPAEEVSLIFNEGFMASNAAPADDLEGMGMYKCAIALEKMCYGYEIRSTLGMGTTFIIDLSK